MKQRREREGEQWTENEAQVVKNADGEEIKCLCVVGTGEALLCQELHTHDSFMPCKDSAVWVVSSRSGRASDSCKSFQRINGRGWA